MQANSGLQSVLRNAHIYNIFQYLIGVKKSRQRLVKYSIRPKTGDKVVEIGCGPSPLLPLLPNVEYFAFDIDENYLEISKKDYGEHGNFFVADLNKLKNISKLRNADLVIICSVLHHLNDSEVVNAMRLAHKILKPGGRVVCGEPCWHPKQNLLAKFVLANDRGKNIRSKEGYLKLIKNIFPTVKTTFDFNPMLLLPSTSIFIECTNNR